MTHQIERALRLEAAELKSQGNKVLAHKGLLYAMAVAKERTAERLEAERLARAAAVERKQGDVVYDPRRRK